MERIANKIVNCMFCLQPYAVRDSMKHDRECEVLHNPGQLLKNEFACGYWDNAKSYSEKMMIIADTFGSCDVDKSYWPLDALIAGMYKDARHVGWDDVDPDYWREADRRHPATNGFMELHQYMKFSGLLG